MSRRWWVLIAIACGTFMATLDSSIVNITLPTLTKALRADLAQTKWVVIIYLLVVTSLLLPFGRMSDQYGRKRIVQSGFIVFLTGSFLCAFSPQLGPLLFARLIQGLGAAMLMANGPAVITSHFPTKERGKALSALAMVVSLGLISGPLIGGLLVGYFSWRSIFLINVPICALGLWLSTKHLPPDKNPPNFSHFDWAGSILQMVFLFCFLILVDPPMISVSGSIPFSIPRLGVLFLTLILGFIFIRVEQETKHPILDLSLLKIKSFWTANLASFLVFVSYSSISILMPFFLEEILSLDPTQTGLMMTAIPLTIFIVAPISGRITDELGARWLRISGTLVGAFGFFYFSSALEARTLDTRFSILLGLCIVGLASGLFQSPNNTTIMSAVPAAKLGAASALLATIRNLGLATGTGLATTLFAWRFETTGDFMQALQITFLISGVIAIAANLVTLPRHRERPQPNAIHLEKEKPT